MKIRFLLSLLLMFALPAALRAGDETVSVAGVFSYEAPAGWTVQNSPASKCPVALGARKDNFTANLNVVFEPFAGTLDDYVAANMKEISGPSGFANLRIIEQKSFQTSAGVRGARVVLDDTQGAVNLQQVFYFFAGSSSNKIIVTGSSLVGDGDRFAPIFDGAMKTFSPQ